MKEEWRDPDEPHYWEYLTWKNSVQRDVALMASNILNGFISNDRGNIDSYTTESIRLSKIIANKILNDKTLILKKDVE